MSHVGECNTWKVDRQHTLLRHFGIFMEMFEDIFLTTCAFLCDTTMLVCFDG